MYKQKIEKRSLITSSKTQYNLFLLKDAITSL